MLAKHFPNINYKYNHMILCPFIGIIILNLYLNVKVFSLTTIIWQKVNNGLHYTLSVITGQLITGSWDKTLKCWDPRGASGQERTLVGTYPQPERVYSLSLVGNRLVVATAGRHVNVYDLRNMSLPEQRRESSLKYQTRCVRCYPNGTGKLQCLCNCGILCENLLFALCFCFINPILFVSTRFQRWHWFLCCVS